MTSTIKRKKKRNSKRRKNQTGKSDKQCQEESLIFQPWFLPPRISNAIRSLLPGGYRNKTRDYFAAYGCIRCNARHAVYGGSGFCLRCRVLIQARFRRCIKKRETASVPRYGMKLLSDSREARKLLRGFPSKMYIPHKEHKIYNPVTNAFVVLDPEVESSNSVRAACSISQKTAVPWLGG